MADKPADKSLLPGLVPQNPSGVSHDSQGRKRKVRDQVDRIMEVFLQVLPSNYVSKVQGPFYTMQFQAAAEQIADFQITAQESFADRSYDYTRPEFLFQVLGRLVFPDAASDGIPRISGDLTYRQFLKRMVEFLLGGATKATIEGALAVTGTATQAVFAVQHPDLVRDLVWKVIEKSIETRKLGPKSGWDLDDQFTFEVNVSQIAGTSEGETLFKFPEDPFKLQENVRIVLRALKPAHTLYDYRHLFRDAFGQLFDDSMSFEWSNYYYLDFRRFCTGAERVAGEAGETLTDRTLFSDPNRDFSAIRVGATLTILSGPNSIHAGGTEGSSASTDMRHIGRHRVKEILSFPVADSEARAYTTSPTGLVGSAKISGDVIEDHTPIGILANNLLAVPNTGGVRFGAGAFFIRLGDTVFTLVGVASFSADPGSGFGIEYLTAATATEPIGRLKFGSQLLTEYAGKQVIYVGDWRQAVEGEIITFTAGSNIGSYRLKTLLGSNGGPVGEAPGPAWRVRAAPSILRLENRMAKAATGQSYTVGLDHLGVQVPHQVQGEDVSEFFYL